MISSRFVIVIFTILFCVSMANKEREKCVTLTETKPWVRRCPSGFEYKIDTSHKVGLFRSRFTYDITTNAPAVVEVCRKRVNEEHYQAKNCHSSTISVTQFKKSLRLPGKFLLGSYDFRVTFETSSHITSSGWWFHYRLWWGWSRKDRWFYLLYSNHLIISIKSHLTALIWSCEVDKCFIPKSPRFDKWRDLFLKKSPFSTPEDVLKHLEESKKRQVESNYH